MTSFAFLKHCYGSYVRNEWKMAEGTWGAIRRLKQWSKQEGMVAWTVGRMDFIAVERSGPVC